MTLEETLALYGALIIYVACNPQITMLWGCMMCRVQP